MKYTNNDNGDENGSSVEKYLWRVDDKGRNFLKAVYLKQTPKEEIERLNALFPDSKNKVKVNKGDIND